MKAYLPLAIVLGLLCIAIPVSAATWYVDDDGEADFTSILDAVNNASSGDTICVLPGTYSVFSVTKPYLTIRSEEGPGSVTVDCGSSEGICSRDNATGLILDGLTIVNPGGCGLRLGEYGPAPDSIIRNCTFNGIPSAIELRSPNCTFENNVIKNSTGSECSILLWGADGTKISDNLFIDNVAGLWQYQTANTLITGNNFTRNGCAISFYDETNAGTGTTFSQNTFLDNTVTCAKLSGWGGDFVGTWNSTAPVTYTYNGVEYTGFVGNFWSNYTATDADGDGILDAPHVLPDGLGTDYAPLAGAWEDGVIAGSPVPEPKTWYVDDDGEADFTSIGDAVNNASSGDTIYVLPGTYSWFWVTKPYLTILAVNNDGSAVVNCTGDTAEGICSSGDATGMVLDGLTIVNLGGCGLRLGENGPAHDSIIRNCTFLGLGASEALQIKASNVTFADNIVSNATCKYSALTLKGNGCLVSNNIITSSAGAAISCSGAGSTGNLITNNTLSNNRYGIEFYKSGGDNAVYLNNFVDSINGDVLCTSSINVQVWNSTAPVTYTCNGVEHTGFVGNFWSSYAATDADGDGILDTPHVLPDGLGTDHAPLAGAWEDGVIAGSPAPVPEPKTWYVDDDGDADFTTIQAAVDAASAGDTICVLSGTYSRFEVSKPNLTIRAIETDGPVIIDGSTGELRIPSDASQNATGTVISGFTFECDGNTPIDLGTYGPADDSIIRNCIFSNSSTIRLSNEYKRTFENNVFTNPGNVKYGVIMLQQPANCSINIFNNTFKNVPSGGYGIILSFGSSATTNVTIAENTFDSTYTGNSLTFYTDNGEYLFSQNNNVTGVGVLSGTAPTTTHWNSTAPVTYTCNGVEHTGFVGNFWSSYAATDADGDGILDTPHVLPDGLGTDHAPLVGAWEDGVIVAGPAPATPSDVTITSPAPGSTYEIGIPVQFSATATGADLTYTWETGDGGNATGQDVTYTYSKPGTYTVTLTVSNEHGSSSAETGIVVTKPDPIVFNTSVTVYADEPIVVDNTTYGGNTFFNILATAGYTYTYGDSESNYSDRKPLLTLTIDDVTYPTRDFGADYKWKFYETIGTGNDNKFKKSLNGYIDKSGTYYIWYGDMSQFDGWDLPSVNNSTYVVELTVDLQPTRPDAPVAGFAANTTSGDAPLAVAFTDTSTDASSWSWTFGDGATSTEQHPVHTYTAPGTYTVTLTVANTAGSDSATKIITVSEAGGEEANVLTLHRGWNFVSTPKRLAAGANTFAIFNGVDTAGHTILLYDGLDYDWKMMSPTDAFRPLDAVWIYANTSYSIPLTFAAGAPELPPTKDLGKGWNAIGFTGTAPEVAAPTLLSLGDRWTTLISYDAETQGYKDSVIRDTPESETQKMQPMQGYWIYMTQAETLAAISG